ncbi:ABC transporter permease [Roseobacter sp. YSTF-M11]|uniref:ABC transporter permease n=1 Tax=Roseobacter insulae TaxID=2859783 RepID=A0A9X1FX24_9RHOB|nr:ABC transporter permease [Roseobacter insulae]MBW4709237.1 ABC transporter permease [Roseobacter insulae]
MMALWNNLPGGLQDTVFVLALLVPAVALCAGLWRGFAPGPLIRALLWRYRWTNLGYVILIAISIGLSIAIVMAERGLREGSATAADKFDLIVTAPGNETTMMLATVYLRPTAMPLLSGDVYNDIASAENVAMAAPLSFGDSVNGMPIVGTIADFVSHLGDGQIQGRMWQDEAEAVAGALSGLHIGDEVAPAHGIGDDADNDAHGDFHIEIVGKLPPTGSPWDRAVIVPIESVWHTHGLASGHPPDRANQIGPPFDPAYFPGTPAIVVRADALFANYALRSAFSQSEQTMAFFPGTVLARLHSILGDIRRVMSWLTIVTQCLVGMSVLLGLFILSRLFSRQISLLRTLGAPSRFVVCVVWSYNLTLVAAGTVLGILVAWAATAGIAYRVSNLMGFTITTRFESMDFAFIAAFLSGVTICALLPILVSLNATPVQNLND